MNQINQINKTSQINQMVRTQPCDLRRAACALPDGHPPLRRSSAAPRNQGSRAEHDYLPPDTPTPGHHRAPSDHTLQERSSDVPIQATPIAGNNGRGGLPISAVVAMHDEVR